MTDYDPPPPEPNPLGDEEGDEAPEWWRYGSARIAAAMERARSSRATA
jgi:hypothetical protein